MASLFGLAKSQGPLSGEAKQRNRALRNDVDTRSALTGITWKQGEKMWRDKYGKNGIKLSLNSDSHLQQIYDLMGSGGNRKPGASTAATTSQNNLDQSNAAFNKRLSTIQSQNKSQIDDLQSQLKISSQNYEKQIGDMNNLIGSYQNAFTKPTEISKASSSLSISPAMSTAEKSKTKTKGTGQFNRSLRINNLNI